MKNITIVLQRSELNYLIKYDALKVSPDRMINFSFNEFNLIPPLQKTSILQYTLPLYEQEHEVLFIEYESQLISYDNGPSLEFKGILSIIPLTETGAKLLSSKLNTDIIVLDPLDAQTYMAFINNRNHLLRYRAGQALCSLYDVPLPAEEFITDFNKATLFQINDITPKKNDTTLAHLVAFNITPSFIPEGNIEAIIKVACVAMKKLNKAVDQITKSIFYNSVINEKQTINSATLFEAIRHVEHKIDLDIKGKEKFNLLTDTLSDYGKYENAFLLFSYFYYLKKVIEKNDYNVSIPKDDILELKYYNISAASRVLFMLGYTFSIQTISKSLQSFSNSKLLKTENKIDLEWFPTVKEQKVIKESKLEKKGFNEDGKSIEIKFLNAKKHGVKPATYFSNTSYKLKDKKAIEINHKDSLTEVGSEVKGRNERLPEIVLDQDVLSVESKMSNIPELEGIGLFSNKIEVIKMSLFTFLEFEENLKLMKRKEFSIKIVNELRATEIGESEITEDILIKCLKAVNEYETKKGGLKITAKDALKVFKELKN